MDRQQLPTFGRPLQQLDGQQLSILQARPPPDLDSASRKVDRQTDRIQASKENSMPPEGVPFGKSEYVKDKQPARSILRKADGPGLQALQSKFSSLQDDVLNFNAQRPTRRDSLSGRGGLPAPSHPPQQEAPPAPPGGVPGLRPLDTAAGASRTVLVTQAASLQQHGAAPCTQDAGASPDDDVGLELPVSQEGLVKLPAGNLANTKAAKAALEAFEEPLFKQQCTDGLTKQLKRTRDGATDKSRIQELAELVKLLRKCLREMGSRATSYIDKCAVIERECAQQIEGISLSAQRSQAEAEAEMATVRAKLATAEQDYKNDKALLARNLDKEEAEVSRLRRELERVTEERDRAREEANRVEQQRGQLELGFKELRKAASQQQRDLSVSQSEAMRLLTEEKTMIEDRFNSLRDEYCRQSSKLEALQERARAFEETNRTLQYKTEDLEGRLASKESLLAIQQDQAAKHETALAEGQQQLAALKELAERLKQELQRSQQERSTLEAFVEAQASELDSQRGRAATLETALARERSSWEELRRKLETAMSAAGEQASSLAAEVAQVKAALSTMVAQKNAAESTAALVAMEKASLKRDYTNLQNQLEFAEDRATQMEQQAAAQRGVAEAIKAELEACRQNVAEKDVRLERLEGEFAALKEVLGENTSTEGENGKEIVTKLLSKIASLQHAAVAAEAVRRQLHNELVDIRGNIRVYCRVRPHAAPATRLGADGGSIVLAVEGREHSFTYDRVFGPQSTQEDVFGAVSDLVQSSLDGFHVCVFSYGQTGAGKTHTMQGGSTEASRGIIPRALEKILATARKLEEEAEWSFKMNASFIEVYNQMLRDLLAQGATIQENNAIKHDANGGHTAVIGAKEVEVRDMQIATELVRQAAEARAVVATAMNSTSSRSHCVFMLNITGYHPSTGTRLQGSLCLVDLAGSERLDRSQAEGAAKKEACAINSSLSALGDVFAALSAKNSHVPYRNSKLTYLLQPCLGGNGKTLMFVNINPEPASAGESLCSLRFAAKVNGCETGAKGGARRNVQTFGGGSGGGVSGGELEIKDPAGPSRFSLGCLPKPPPGGMETSSAKATRRTSLVPLRPGGEGGGAARTRSAGATRPSTGISGTNAGVKRPGSTLLDNAAKRTKS